MRTTILVLVLAIGLSGCVVKNDKDKGKAVTAAQALTNAVSFEGGELVEGLMPEPTASGVVLIGTSDTEIEPGDTSLLEFDVTPADSELAAALIQFGGVESYFLIDSDGFQNDTDGGTSDTLHVALSFTTKNDACEQLCDTVHPIEITRAVKLRGGKISKHGMATLMLDCTVDGDPERCTGNEAEPGKTNREDAGGDVVPDAGLVSGRNDGSVGSLIGMMNLQACGGEQCDGIDAYLACVQEACDSVYKQCLGGGYAAGDYTGSICEAYGECYAAAEDPCTDTCEPSGECDACLMQASSCAQTCISELDCSNVIDADASIPDLGDASFPDLSGTCEDLDACCASIEESALKTQCETTADQFRSFGGDTACSAAISSYCP